MSHGAGLRAGLSAAGHLLRRVRRPAKAEALGALRRLARMHRRRMATHGSPLRRRQTQQPLHLWRHRRGARTRAGAQGGRVGGRLGPLHRSNSAAAKHLGQRRSAFLPSRLGHVARQRLPFRLLLPRRRNAAAAARAPRPRRATRPAAASPVPFRLAPFRRPRARSRHLAIAPRELSHHPRRRRRLRHATHLLLEHSCARQGPRVAEGV